MVPDQPTHLTPLRNTLGGPRATKTGLVIDDQLCCPDHPARLLSEGSGTVRRCPACLAKILQPAGGAE